MSQNNKGYTMISSIIIMSVIVTICLMCINLLNSSSKNIKLDSIKLEMKENVYSGLEIVRSNLLTEVRNAVENCDNKLQFIEYFRGNDSYRSFINKIKDTSMSDIKNIDTKILYNNIIEKNEGLYFDIQINSSKNRYMKKIQASILIEYKNSSSDDKQLESEDLENIVSEESENLDLENKHIDEKDLIKIENIKEI